MTRFLLGKQAALALAAAFCFALSAILLLLALDVQRWREALSAGDVLYRVSPGASDWQPDARVPLGVAEGLVDVEDDVEFRLALRAFRLA